MRITQPRNILAFFTLAIASVFVVACQSTGKPGADSRFEYQQPEMGLPFRIVLYAKDKTTADNAATAAYKRIEQLNDLMSDYDATSELSQLSATSGTGKTVKVSNDLWVVLTRAQKLAERSNGAFDITVGPCVKLWRIARREHKMPDPDRLAKARESVGYKYVRLNEKTRSVELLKPGMSLDLGGIAKGYAVDEAMKVLVAHGIESALVSGGGDMVVSDPPPGKKAWRIELAPLDAPNAPPTRYVLLNHRALATSGDLFQRLEIDGKRYSHIVDPRTGIGLTDHSLVLVIAQDCMTADSSTKVASVLGPEKGLALLTETPALAARIVRKPGDNVELYETKSFARYFDKN